MLFVFLLILQCIVLIEQYPEIASLKLSYKSDFISNLYQFYSSGLSKTEIVSELNIIYKLNAF